MVNIKLSRLGSKIYYISLFFVFCLLIAFPNSAFPITVIVEGVESLSGKNVSSARAMALSNALKTATEKTAKEINPNLDDKSIEKLTYENPAEYIRSYRILNENRVGEEYKINLEAEVDSEKLRNKLKPFTENPIKPLRKPSTSIIVLRTPDNNPIVKTLSLDNVKSEISRVLIGSGYKVVEPVGDVRLETYISLKTTETRLGENNYSALGNVFIKAKDKNGIVLSEVSDSSYLSGRDLAQLSLDALKQAGANAAVKLRGEFDRKWNTSQKGKSKNIEIAFVGLNNYKQYEELDYILGKSTQGIDSITKRVFSNNRISFFIISSIDQYELAKTIENQKKLGFSLKLNNISQDKIEFEIVSRVE
jgi:hypothetical protein